MKKLELSPELAELLAANEHWQQFADWLPAEREAFRPPEKLTVSEWADRYRVLPVKNQAEPGPWETSRTPYLREIMDAMHDPGARWITFCKSTQIGGSEAMNNCLAWVMDQDPDPAVYLMPTDKARDEFMRDRIKPMVEGSPRLRRLKSSRKADWKKDRIDFPGMTLWVLTAGSAVELASRSVRWVFQDRARKSKQVNAATRRRWTCDPRQHAGILRGARGGSKPLRMAKAGLSAGLDAALPCRGCWLRPG